MKITSVSWTAPGLLLGVALVVGQERQNVPTFASKVELVTVDAVVVDGKDRPVRGLKSDDFVLVEDGKPQKVESFEAFDLGDAAESAPSGPPPGPAATNLRSSPRASRSFVLLVDDMSLAPSRQEVVRTAIARFLNVGLRDGDEVIFATTSSDTWWSARMPGGREDLEALAARVRGRSLVDTGRDAVSEWEAYRIVHSEGGTGGAGESGAGPPTPEGPPGGGGPQPVPGGSMMDRVTNRYYERGVCPPELPVLQCNGLVLARAQQVDQRRVVRTRDALAAVDRSVFALTGVRGRKALLFLTEGFLSDADLGLAQEVAGRCREANLVVYSLDVRGLMTGLAGADEAYVPNTGELALMQMEETEFAAAGSVGLAEDTGGFAVRNTNDLAAGAARVADESRTYYLLGYAPPEGKGPRDWRKLKVEVRRPGLKVRARKGYTLRTAAEIAMAAESRAASANDRTPAGPPAKEGAPLRLPADVARSLASAHEQDAIPLRAMAYTLDGRPSGAVRTLLAVEIDTRSLANLGGEERARSVLTLSIAATHRDSGKTQHLDQRLEVDAASTKDWEGWLALNREFDLPPGVAQARVVVRDEFLGRLGAVSVRFVVPEAGGLRLSTPLLTDRLASADKASPSRPVLAAHREFKGRGRLYCQFQVFGAERGASGAGVEASYSLRRRDGDVVRSAPLSPIAPSPDGRLVRLLALSVDDVAPGDYELVLRVEDKATGQTRERVEPLRILPASG